MSAIEPDAFLATYLTPSGQRWLQLAARQGYHGESGMRLARRADALYPMGLAMHAACEVITNLADELNLPLPEKP